MTFRDWSNRLFQQSPLYDLRLTRSSKTRSVISLLAEVPSRDHLNLSYRVQRSEIGRPTTLYFGKSSNKQCVGLWNGNSECRSCALI